jgi:NHLM bacteriocin system ABC transporter ATP-binding protein
MNHPAMSFPPDARADGDVVLPEAGNAFEIGNDRPFLLDDDSVWVVRTGAVDIFAVALGDDGGTGRRAHLFRIQRGDPMFGLAGSTVAGRALLAVGTNGTSVSRTQRDVLRGLSRDPMRVGEVRTLLERWIELVCGGIARDVVPARCADLEPGAPIAIEQPAAARPGPNVVWLRHLRGRSLLLGQESLTINGHGYLPLSRRAWLEVREPSTLTLARADELDDPDELWDGLDRLHVLVLRYTELLAAQADAAALDRLRRRSAASDAMLEHAVTKLAESIERDHELGIDDSVLRARTSSSPTPDATAALFAAARMVAAATGIALDTSRAVDAASAARDPLQALLRASRVRSRKVALRDKWWQQDSGPLLGYRASEPQPVALLPNRRRGYLLKDPATGEQRPVDATVAATLAPFAITLYRPFPDVALGVRQLFAFGVRDSRKDLWMVVAMGLCGAILGMVPAVATGVIFNTVIPGAQRSQLLQLTIVLLVCAVTNAMFTLARGVALLRVEGAMGSSVQAAVWDRLLSLPLPFFRPYTAGNLAVRAMAIDSIRQVISGTTVTAIMGGIFSIGNFALMYYYSATMAWRGTLLILAAITITAFGSYLQLRPQRGVMALQAKTSGLVLQLLTSIAKLRVAAAEAPAFALWARHFSAQRRLQYRVRRVANWVSAFNAAFPVAAYILLFWTALSLLGGEHTLRIGDFLAFLSAFGSCSGALLSTSGALLGALSVVPLYEQAKPILQTLPEVDVGKTDPGSLSGDIEIQHAMFKYNADGPIVLHDVSLHIRAGEFVAFVGPSGSGKSTLLRLLIGFEALDSGAIYYDGQEIADLDVQAIRRQMGVVLQSGRLMSGDIYTNIVGSSPVGVEEAWEAARMAGFADDIKSMPMGMYTVVNEGGGTLSGGQRQRLMIARAIVHRPRILLFDEATSALDNRTQAIVSDSLTGLQATRVVIAHRLSTIINADRIYVMERGRLAQAGTYGELVHQEGLFADLARRQIT